MQRENALEIFFFNMTMLVLYILSRSSSALFLFVSIYYQAFLELRCKRSNEF